MWGGLLLESSACLLSEAAAVGRRRHGLLLHAGGLRAGDRLPREPLPSLGASTALVAETLPLLCVSIAFAWRFYCPRGYHLGYRLDSLETMYLLCVLTVVVAKTLPLLCVSTAL